jgi:murein DD-endopeptidase MepM/ murein hydrolase activator NlpD
LIVKFIYKLFLSIIFTLLVTLNTYALDIELKPEEVNPGDIIFLKADYDTTSYPEAEFLGKKIKFHRTGEDYLIALIPVEVSTPPGDYTVSIKDGEERQNLNVKVKSYEFPSIKLTVSEEKVTLSAEDQTRVEEEYLLQNKLWEMSTEMVWNGGFIMPTDTPVSEKFGIKRIFNEKKTSVHRGIDLKGKTGTPIRAINSGKVVLRKNLFYGGDTLVLDHGMGLLSVYMHLSEFTVSEDAMVEKGEIVGLVGMTGRATGPHLHMSVKLQGVSVNPLSLIGLDL